jgi:hypothetical protein
MPATLNTGTATSCDCPLKRAMHWINALSIISGAEFR